MTTTAPEDATRHESLLSAMADQLGRQQRGLHALKAQLARGETDVERAMHVVLFVLADTGPLRVSALADRLGTDPSTTSRQTGELVKRELLQRLPDPDDRRACLLAVTSAGHDVVAAMKERRHERLARAVETFSDEEIVTFTDLISRFADGLEQARSDAGSPRPGPAAGTPAAPDLTPDLTPDTAQNNAQDTAQENA